ncbi:hypothetical protein BSZ07_35855 [Streptomyces sp. M1013]|nr:hypothetical protein BSZ07_35855 [Streptomyces sp. M1013]
MTTTRSAVSATTARSWVISTTAMSCLCWRVTRRSRIWRCTVTSRAVVGSSAMRRRGRATSAVAIITRWRRPPESSCGYWR